MRKDLRDYLESISGCLPLRGVLFGASMWVGSLTGGISLMAGHAAGGFSLGFWDAVHLLFPVLLLMNELYCLTLLALWIGMFLYWRVENTGYVFWGVLTSVFGVLTLAGASSDFGSLKSLLTAWILLPVLLCMMGVGLWFLRQWEINRWAGELALLRSENAAKRANREAQRKKGEPQHGGSPD